MAEIYDDDVERNDKDCALTKRDFQDLARYYIRTFFRNKVDEYGSQIDPEELLTDRNISLVLNTSICNGLPDIYSALKPLFKGAVKKKGKYPEDVELVLKLLRELAKLSLPKTSFTGLIAIYLEVCKGCKVDIDIDDE